MEILIAKHSGFCSGVKNAYRKALELTATGEQVYMLGLLVHNTLVINKLRELGVISLDSISQIPQGSTGYLIISAHGVGPDIYEEAKATGLKIIDTTCPWVKKAQTIAKDLFNKGSQVIIIGDKNHTEVKGIKAWTHDCATVIESADDAVSFHGKRNIGILAQTTQSLKKFEEITGIFMNKTGNVEIRNTICDATTKMQQSAIDTAKSSDIMIVIGDQKSANTKRLKELCQATGVSTFRINTSEELDPKWFRSKKNVGITAGASTPDWIIKDVVDKIRDMI